MLSKMHAHLPADTDARWTKIHGREDCDECVMVQHETHGTTRRQPARHTRTSRGHALALCVVHAEEWKAKDRGE
jgi:hypothetical protein